MPTMVYSGTLTLACSCQQRPVCQRLIWAWWTGAQRGRGRAHAAWERRVCGQDLQSKPVLVEQHAQEARDDHHASEADEHGFLGRRHRVALAAEAAEYDHADRGEEDPKVLPTGTPPNNPQQHASSAGKRFVLKAPFTNDASNGPSGNEAGTHDGEEFVQRHFRQCAVDRP